MIQKMIMMTLAVQTRKYLRQTRDQNLINTFLKINDAIQWKQ
jgi:hypothetical protein